MIFRRTEITGVLVLETERYEDERGFFARTWCAREAEAHGIDSRIAQCSISFNRNKGTLRGMHWQVAPCEEAKLVRATRGTIYDVVVDLRPQSPTCGRYVAEILSADQRNALYVPAGFAHGFLTLENDTEVYYQISEFYAPDAARGFRWNDPRFSIRWPMEPVIMSQRDRTYPDFSW